MAEKDEIRDELARSLAVPAELIGDHDDLIALGLDSIRTMKIAGGWRKRGHDVNFAQLAAAPTVADWHALLSASACAREQPAEPSIAEENEPFPLAEMQHAYWIGRSDRQRLGGVAAHLYVEFDAHAVDPVRLERAVAELVDIHPMLRTRVLPDGTQQTLSAPGRPVFTLVDLRADSDPERALEVLRENKSHQRLVIEDGQVLDITLTLLPGGRSRLHLDIDMIAGDAMSYRLLVADLAASYGGQPLVRPDYSYRRYRTEQQIDSARRERDRQWWQQRLPQLPGAPQLPTVAESDGNRTVRHHYWIEPAAKQRLLDAAHARGITPAMALAAVFAETVGGWSDSSKFLLNVPLFHREPVHPDIDRIVGDFTSSILLEVDVSENVTVADRARALQRTMHESCAHAGYSGLEVLRDLGRLRGEPVLAPVVYTSALNLGELFAPAVTETFGEPVWIISQGPQVLLDAQVTEVRGGLLLNWDVRESAFPAGMVEAMFTQYTEAVCRLGEGEAGWAAEAPVRLPIAQARVRAGVNATDGPVSGRRLHQGFFEHAETNPDAPAVLWRDGSWSYRQLAARALAVAGMLRTAGVGMGDAVAVQLPKGPDQVLAVLGVLAAGATYVPIGFDQPAARRDRILHTGGVVAAITLAGMEIPDLACLDPAVAREWSEPLTQALYPDPEAAAYVLFTSGSTGVPKGVEVPHRAAMNILDALNEYFDIGGGDRSLAASALEFDLSVYDIFGLLSVGGAVVVPDARQRIDPELWVEAIDRHDVSVLNCVPSVLDMVLDLGTGRLDSLRAVLLGGDWVGVESARRLKKQAPGCRFAGLGGATETAIHSTICEIVDPPADWVTVPFGVPLRNVRCRIVAETGRDCPDWVPGELWVGGANVATGYRNDPERTAARFVECDGIRWYRTGDLARYWPDGTIEFLGRADHQVQLRGYRVELGEVESALRMAPGVRQAVAVVQTGGSPRLVAAVAGEGLSTVDIAAVVAQAVPGYMVPEQITVLDRMPLTPNGKLDRRRVSELLVEDSEAVEFSAARTDLEAVLADLAAGVLGVNRVGVLDDFFSLGGDSVQATTMVARVRDWLGIDHLMVGDLFTARTVAGLAQRLEQRDDPERLSGVARLYLEVVNLTDEQVLAQM